MNGNLRQGTKGCEADIPACEEDGDKNCVASDEYPAVKRAQILPQKILTGVTIAGVSGTVAACTSDGDKNCVATDEFPAVEKQQLAEKVVSGTTVAGVAGEVVLPPANAVLSGVRVGASGTGMVTLPTASDVRQGVNFGVDASLTGSLSPGSTTLPNCSSDGATGCVAVSNFPAVDKATKLLAGNIKSGVSIAGITGGYPSAQYPLTGADSTVADLPLFSATTGGTSYEWFKGDGTRVTGSIEANAQVTPGISAQTLNAGLYRSVTVAGDADLVAGKILTGIDIFGVVGNVAAKPADCAADGATGCVAVSNFPAVDKATKLLAGNIKSGVTIASVLGAYPSADHPLAGADSAVADLPAFSATTGGTSYEWFKADGTRLTGAIEANAQVTPGASATTLAAGLYRSVTVAGDADLIDSNIKTGVNVFGVSGNLVPRPDTCAADGASGCVVVGPTMAAAVTTGIADKILTGNTIANVAGNVTLPAEGKVLTGTQFGVSGTGSTGTLTLPAAGNVLSSSGSFGDPAAAVTPTLMLPAAANVLVSNGAYGIGGNGSAPTLTLPGAADVYNGISYGVGGNGSTGTLTLASAANVRTGQGAFGRGGNSVTPTLSDCSSDGVIDCVAVTAYKAANMTNVTAANIRSGVTIAGVAGAYPSATNTLPGATGTTDLASLASSTAAGTYEWWDAAGTRYTGTISDAGTITPTTSDQTFSTSVYRTFTVAGSANLTAANIKNGTAIFGVTGAYPSSTNLLTDADNTADLDFATFDAKIKSSASFEWFDAAGNRYTNTGDTDIAAGNIANGISIFGTAGALAGGSFCSGDGQTGCVTTSRYKSMDTDASVITAWDIRKGKTAGGLAGEIVFYKNMANTTFFNRTSGTSALSGVDAYDTIDDNNNYGTFPTQNPSGWDQATGANWLRDSVSDTGAGGGVASDGICNGSEDCVYIDRVTGLYWLRDDATSRTWETAITYCENSTSGGYSDWRLPTQKELMQAYTNGAWSQKDATRLNLATSYYWSSSTQSNDATGAWVVYLGIGDTYDVDKTLSNRVLCAR